MNNLQRQTRVRFSDPGEGGLHDTWVPPKKTVSFKGDRKRTGRRFLRQLSGQMSDADHASDGDIETAIAAATYAITYMEEEGSSDQKKPTEGWMTQTKTKSKKENSMNEATNTADITKKADTIGVINPPNIDSTTRGKTFRKSKSLDELMLEDTINNGKMPGKAMGATPTIKKTPTFSDKYLNGAENNAFEGNEDMKAEQPEAVWYPRTKAMKSRKEENKAVEWEKEQMDKIRKWYDKMNSRIIQWESEKKMKARRPLERKERELEEMRARYLQEHRNEISGIDKITRGARAASEERKRNKELKTVEKAKQIRSKGKAPPRKCFCF